MKEMTEGSGDKPRTDNEKHLKYYQPYAAANRFNEQKDGAPTFGGTVVRVRGGRKRSTPIVAQSGFDLYGEPTVEFQALTGGKLKRLTPIEEEVRQSTQGYIEPQTSTRAERQRKAISQKSGRR